MSELRQADPGRLRALSVLQAAKVRALIVTAIRSFPGREPAKKIR